MAVYGNQPKTSSVVINLLLIFSSQLRLLQGGLLLLGELRLLLRELLLPLLHLLPRELRLPLLHLLPRELRLLRRELHLLCSTYC